MVIIVFVIYIYRNTIAIFILENIIYGNDNDVLSYNEYYKEEDYLYVKNIETNKITKKEDILNMFYSIINSGDESYTFTCDYDNCTEDVIEVIDDEFIIPNLNNFVHPFNSFEDIKIKPNTLIGRFTIIIEKKYSKQEIEHVENYIDSFISNNINDTMNNKEKIKLFHDHIINNTIYDQNDSSYTAYSLLTKGRALCGGYSDIMAIYLEKININNYKITSTSHVWNLVYTDNKWLHLDLTWDDPVTSDGNQYLLHNFFLINSDELLKLDDVEHNFDKNIYLELK